MIPRLNRMLETGTYRRSAKSMPGFGGTSGHNHFILLAGIAFYH